MWQAMMTAMMAPTAWPWVRAFDRFTAPAAGRLERWRLRAAFVSGYLTIWLAFSVAAATVQLLLAHAGLETGRLSGVGPGVALLVAGLFQLAPLKRSCLTHCRNPFSYLLARWRNGPAGGFRLGLGHGAYCVGCCWALMSLPLALGLMNLWLMAALTVFVFLEQAVTRTGWLRVAAGWLLLAAGMSGPFPTDGLGVRLVNK